MHKKIKILLIEDEQFDVLRVQRTLQPFENQIQIVDYLPEGVPAVQLLQSNPEICDVVIMDFQITGGLMGENLIKKIKEVNPTLQIIVITKMTVNLTDFDFANTLLKAGAFWYCTKYPVDIEDYIYQPTDFVLSIFNAYEKGVLERQRFVSEQKLNKTVMEILEQRKIIGNSPATLSLLQQIEKYSARDVNILITGESGTGKELVAQNLHYRSSRKYENFVPINCGSIPTELIESELFGYEKGSFTGAGADKIGLFEAANNGTIFLDEVTGLPQSAQVKLLRVIQEGEIEKLGRTKKIKVNVRIIAATNEDIKKQVEEKRFREDLYYRLSVVPIHVSPLRERREDIPPLVDHFLTEFCSDYKVPKPAFNSEAMDTLSRYEWSGNVRELKNVLQRLLFNEERMFSYINVLNALGVVKVESSPDPYQLRELFNKNQILSLKNAENVFREKYLLFARNNSNSDADTARKLGLAQSNYSRIIKNLGMK
ncbi:MAG: sigma-54 dependent transcriptional regulator [Bacteroidota bacterium]